MKRRRCGSSSTGLTTRRLTVSSALNFRSRAACSRSTIARAASSSKVQLRRRGGPHARTIIPFVNVTDTASRLPAALLAHVSSTACLAALGLVQGSPTSMIGASYFNGLYSLSDAGSALLGVRALRFESPKIMIQIWRFCSFPGFVHFLGTFLTGNLAAEVAHCSTKVLWP